MMLHKSRVKATAEARENPAVLNSIKSRVSQQQVSHAPAPRSEEFVVSDHFHKENHGKMTDSPSNVQFLNCVIHDFHTNLNWLVVDLHLWKIWKSMGMIITDIWKNTTCSKPSTSKWFQVRYWNCFHRLKKHCSLARVWQLWSWVIS